MAPAAAEVRHGSSTDEQPVPSLLDAQLELWHHTLDYIKAMALKAALDLCIADAIHHHGGTATLPQILAGIGISPCKLAGLRRLMRVLTVAGTFTTIQQPETSSGGHDELVYKLSTVSRLLTTSDDDGETSASCLSPMLSHVLNPFHDSVLSMGLTAWFRHDEEPDKCPYALMRGATVWEMCGSSDAVNASINNAMAADSRFLMRMVMEECGGIFRGINSLVDVAGGVGGAAAAIAAAFPSLKCTVLDLPHVVAKAPSVSNVQFIAGDMFESIPAANAIFLKVSYLKASFRTLYGLSLEIILAFDTLMLLAYGIYMGIQIIVQLNLFSLNFEFCLKLIVDMHSCWT